MGIYLYFGGRSNGPFSLEELQLLWQENEIPSEGLYWFEGMRDWRAIADFKPPPTSNRLNPATVILTTAFHVANREIETEIDIISAECVLGMSFLRDLLTGLTDVFGGRSDTMQGELRRARTTCLLELRKEAVSLGANAVIGVDLDYSEISGQGKSMLFLVASGTAVRLKVVPPPLPAT